MKSNFDYVMKNFEYGGNIVDWLYCIKNFFGDEQTDAFCEYFINEHQIMRKNDIRNLIQHHSLSVYSFSNKEQLAFVSIYIPINTESNLIKNREDGLEKAQKFYRNKNVELSKKIKKLGYSYSTTLGNWKDLNKKDTYQREYVFIIYSEKDTEEQFKANILNLVKEYNVKTVLITDTLTDKSPKLQIQAKLFEVETGNVIKEFNDTTVDVVERFFSNVSNTKMVFKIPYENNKRVLYLEDKHIGDYYSLEKQKKVKETRVQSFNMGIIKQFLESEFDKENYNK